jgi:hypothetical protein
MDKLTERLWFLRKDTTAKNRNNIHTINIILEKETNSSVIVENTSCCQILFRPVVNIKESPHYALK